MDKTYKKFLIQKSSGKFREIYAPSDEYKSELKNLIPKIEDIKQRNFKIEKDFAFQKKKNCAMNAIQHINKRYVLSMDIEDFFDSIKKSHVKNIIPAEIIEYCFIEEAPRQGLPTSPIISSIAFQKCDAAIEEFLKSTKKEITYSRYADDLTFSFNEKELSKFIEIKVSIILMANGFKINRKKTKLQDAKNGRIIITGLALSQYGLLPTRKTLRKIRAATHQGNTQSARGLIEWAQCKLPREI